MTDKLTAVQASNQFLELNGRRLAFRSIGTGKPIVLCCRFRGNMDTWDPAFLDGLASQGFRVITFDYTGLGLSTGIPTYNPLEMVRDPIELIEALQLEDVVIAGWSLGGIVAQIVVAKAPHRLSHGVLIATTPPGPAVKLAEQIFYDTAKKPENTLEDEMVLFFEPTSEASREAAKRSAERIAQRKEGRSVPVPAQWAAANLGDKPREQPFPALPILEALKHTKLPLLHIGGDHDIIFPVENWYALNQQLPTLQLLTYPRAGHGPQHQYPEATAEHIGSFVRSTAG
jgi:pimeloyl-ACP methyl ester carboxylesterase